MTHLGKIVITPRGVELNSQVYPTSQIGDALLTACYRSCHADYPKFFKMDSLCRLGFIASELLLQSQDEERFIPREDRAVVLASCNGCLHTDRHYASTIHAGDNYFPSPAVFVYTLPNIVTGEIAIRNKYLGESSMYIVEDGLTEEELVQRLAELTFQDPVTTSAIIGWVDYHDGDHYNAILYLIQK